MSPSCEDPLCNCGQNNRIRRAQADLDRVESMYRRLDLARSRISKARRSWWGWLFIDDVEAEAAVDAIAFRMVEVEKMVQDARFELDVVRDGRLGAECNRAAARVAEDVVRCMQADCPDCGYPSNKLAAHTDCDGPGPTRLVGLQKLVEQTEAVKEAAKKLDATVLVGVDYWREFYKTLSTEQLKTHLIAALEAWQTPVPVNNPPKE